MMTPRDRSPLPRAAPSVRRRELIVALGLFFAILSIGTTGYMWIEGWSIQDALYMTVITIATVGYGEIHRLSDAGRWFTIVLILSSLGLLGYAVSTIAAFIIEGQFNHFLQSRRMDRRIASIRDHVIVCGAGHTGRAVADELLRTGTPCLLIEHNAESMEHALHVVDVPYLLADATEDETLVNAGIERAAGLISALHDDKENVFVVLSARSLNPNLRIVARLRDSSNANKRRKAGADEIVAPDASGGMRLASLVVRPTVVNFLDQMLRESHDSMRLEEVPLSERSELAGSSLREANVGARTGVLVVAILKQQGSYLFNPSASILLESGDTLIVMGSSSQVHELRELANR